MCSHYASLSQSLDDPVSVGWLLCDHDERILSEETLKNLESTGKSESESRIVLLRAIRGAVHTNYQNLKVFASLLLRFQENVPLAVGILKDYSKQY